MFVQVNNLVYSIIMVGSVRLEFGNLLELIKD